VSAARGGIISYRKTNQHLQDFYCGVKLIHPTIFILDRLISNPVFEIPNIKD
jgi:hypothetical protein